MKFAAALTGGAKRERGNRLTDDTDGMSQGGQALRATRPGEQLWKGGWWWGEGGNRPVVVAGVDNPWRGSILWSSRPAATRKRTEDVARSDPAESSGAIA